MSEYIWLNDFSKQFLENDYLVGGQTVDERVTEICEAAERILNKPGFAKKMKDNIKRGWYSLSSPIWTNFGNDRGFAISCFGSYMEDSTHSILDTHSEVGMMTKYGGGTSAYFGELRGRGAKIKNNGESSGSVHFMQMFDKLINVISQGSTRRGNFAAYLPIEHPDINEFLNIKTEGNPIQDIFFGVTVTDKWMSEMVDGDKDKRKLWAKVIQSRSSVGLPYIVFIDNVNNNTVDVYKDKNMKISHSNLCVVGSQRAVSDRGLLTVKELSEQGGDIILFDNNKAVKSSPMKLIEKNADVWKITLENGMTHTVTSYHKVLTSKRGSGITTKYGREKLCMTECKDLVPGTRVAIQTNPGVFGTTHMPEEAFLLGLYQGDGTQVRNCIMIDIWQNDFDLIPEIQEKFDNIYKKYNKSNRCDHSKFKDVKTREGSHLKQRLTSAVLKNELDFTKGVVPNWIWCADEETQWEYVRGLLCTDGTVHASEEKSRIQLSYASIDRQFVEQLQILFANLGLQTSIKILKEAGKSLLPDSSGEYRYYDRKDCWRLIVGNKNDCVRIEEKTGFLTRKKIKIEKREYRNNTKKFYEVKSVEYVGKEDVYCCTVDSKEHLWTCNGFITSNCTEIFLPDNTEESFVCDLSSMNILYFDEWKNTDAVETLVYFLDAVMSEFITKAKHTKHMERAVKFAERHRALGIGWIGWHSYLQSRMIPFESMESKFINGDVAKTIRDQSREASAKLAKEYGEPDLLVGYGIRNTTTTAIAPTKSSAFILGQVSEGIEPHRANYYIKDLQKGKFTIKNTHLVALLEEKGKNTEEVWTSILKKSGSVQHLKFLSDHEKSVFKTFSEISPKEVVIQAAQRQKFVDQGQSLNLMIHPSIPAKEVNALIIEAWRLGVKSLYYQIGANAAQEFSRNILDCKSCES
jgi:ribonucleoside-diphosphate reductase alpha chain